MFPFMFKNTAGGRLSGSVGQASDSWFQLRSWSQGPEIQALLGACDQPWVYLSLSLPAAPPALFLPQLMQGTHSLSLSNK